MPFPQEPPAEIEAGDRLLLRELRLEDAAAIFEAVDASREHLRRWLPWVDASVQESDSRAFLEEVRRKRQEGLTVAYGIWEGERFSGIIGLHDINLANGNLQIGYCIRKDAEGRGLITRACREVVRVAFEVLRMERVEIRCAEHNRRSSAVPERLGFAFEGVLRHGQRLRGEYLDMRMYRMLEAEYRALNPR